MYKTYSLANLLDLRSRTYDPAKKDQINAAILTLLQVPEDTNKEAENIPA